MSAEQVNPGDSGPRWFQRLGSGFSTLFIMALTATASQLIAISMAGSDVAPYSNGFSTGGLVSAISALLMWKFAPKWDTFKKAIWGPIILMILLSFLVVGLTNSYDVEIVDQEAKPATESRVYSGKYIVVESKTQICGPGEDYLACVNAHIGNYNSVCLERKSKLVDLFHKCRELRRFIRETSEEYETCGMGCETGGEGKWGWPYLRLKQQSYMASNNDALPRLTHKEHCFFDLGVLKIGTCFDTYKPKKAS